MSRPGVDSGLLGGLLEGRVTLELKVGIFGTKVARRANTPSTLRESRSLDLRVFGVWGSMRS